MFLILNLIGEARDVSSPETNHSLKESKIQEILDYSLLKITLTSNMPVFTVICLTHFPLRFLFPFQIDVYSFGVLLCEMCIRELPDPQNREEQVAMVTNYLFRSLMRRCLQTEPKERPHMEEVIENLESYTL